MCIVRPPPPPPPGAPLPQVLRMGSPVTGLSLSPRGDLLATTHTHQRGVSLWSNQLLFGDPTTIAAYSERPVDVGLPTVSFSTAAAGGGADEAPGGSGGGAAGTGRRRLPLGASDSEGEEGSEGTSSSEGEEEGAGGGGGAAAGAATEATAAHERRDGAGAPVPLMPSMLTLSLLPRTQWENLMHLDVIKVGGASGVVGVCVGMGGGGVTLHELCTCCRGTLV